MHNLETPRPFTACATAVSDVLAQEVPHFQKVVRGLNTRMEEEHELELQECRIRSSDGMPFLALVYESDDECTETVLDVVWCRRDEDNDGDYFVDYETMICRDNEANRYILDDFEEACPTLMRWERELVVNTEKRARQLREDIGHIVNTIGVLSQAERYSPLYYHFAYDVSLANHGLE